MRHRIARIDSEIQNGAFDLPGISQRGTQIIRKQGFDTDLFIEGALKDWQHRFHQIV